MKKYLLLATVRDRIDMVEVVISSINKFLHGWTLVIVVQEYSKEEVERVGKMIECPYHIIPLQKRIGAHSAKIEGIKKIVELSGRFIVCSIDDDMEFIEQTNLEGAITLFAKRSTGFVSAGWVNHETRIPNRITKNVFVLQKIVYTGGGMLFSNNIAELLLTVPNLDYFSDNTVWSLQAYISGYSNYRYLGSIAIHRVCKTGGRREWMHSSEKVLPDERFIKITRGNERFKIKNNYLIGTDSGVTELAKQSHQLNKINE